MKVNIELMDFVPGQDYGSGRKVDNPSAQILALTIMANHLTVFGEEDRMLPLGYRDWYAIADDAMWDWLTKPGKKSRLRRSYLRYSTPHSFRMPRPVYDPLIRGWFDFEWVATTRIGSGTRLTLNSDWDKETPALARCSSDEFVPIINGEIHYPWDPRRYREDKLGNPAAPDRAVYGFWYPKT